MTVARAYADKDTWITEASVTSNFGASPILEIWEKLAHRYSDGKENSWYTYFPYRWFAYRYCFFPFCFCPWSWISVVVVFAGWC